MTDDIEDTRVERAALAAWIAYSVRDDELESDEDGVYNRAAAIRDWNESPDLCTHIGADGFRKCARAALEAVNASQIPLTTLDELNKAHREPTLDDHKRAVKEMLDRGKREQGR